MAVSACLFRRALIPALVPLLLMVVGGSGTVLEATPRSEHETRYDSRGESRHRSVVRPGPQTQVVATLRDRPDHETSVRLGFASRPLDLGPARLRGLHRLLAAPLAFSPRSPAFTEPSDLRLDSALVPSARTGGELRLQPTGYNGGARVFAHHLPQRHAMAGLLLAYGRPRARSASRSADIEVLGSSAWPVERPPRDEWEYRVPMYPGGRVQHLATRINATAPARLGFRSEPAGAAHFTVVSGLSFGARVAPAGFLEGVAKFEPAAFHLAARGGVSAAAYRRPDGEPADTAARRSLELAVLPRAPAGVEAGLDRRRAQDRYYRGDETREDRRYRGAVRIGARGRDGVWGRVGRERREHYEHGQVMRVELRDAIQLRVRAAAHSITLSLEDRLEDGRVVERRVAGAYELRRGIGTVRLRAGMSLREVIRASVAARGELTIGRTEVLLAVESRGERALEELFGDAARSSRDVLVGTVGMRYAF